MSHSAQPLTFIESLLLMLLPYQYQWLVLLFREGCEQLWSWVPILAFLYVLYCFSLSLLVSYTTGLDAQGMIHHDRNSTTYLTTHFSRAHSRSS